MRVILPDKSVKEYSASASTVAHLLADLGCNPVEVLVVRNNTLIPESTLLEDHDEIRIIMVSHGG